MENILLVGLFGIVLGVVISYFFTRTIMKGKVELEKEKSDSSNRGRILELEKENSKLEEKARKVDELKEELLEAKDELKQSNLKNTELEKKVTELKTELANEKESAAEKLKLLEESKEELKNEFKNLSNEILEEKSKKFTETNKENISSILTPLKEEFNQFKKTVAETYDKESRDRTALKTQIDGLKELNERLGKEALNLTNALKGDSQKQGAWGEVILERVLEESGLHKGREYETQASFNDDEGKRKRPDAIVHLPNNKDVIIDSKVSIVAYQEYHKAETEEEKSIHLKSHLQSIKNHIKGLSLKNYDDIEEIRSLDYVLMFIPIESAFMLAMENDSNLFSEAFEKNIVIVTPSTLLVTLKTIQNIWRYEMQNKNAQEIAKRAGDLHDKFVNFTNSFMEIGASIDKAKNVFETSFNRLSKGRGNLVSQAKKIKELGVKSKKELSAKLIENSDDEVALLKNEEDVSE